MHADQLRAVAHGLARDAWAYVESDTNDPDAYWQPDDAHLFVFRLDGAWWGLRGEETVRSPDVTASITAMWPQGPPPVVAVEAVDPPDGYTGHALVRREVVSFPPVESLLRAGVPEVDAWLAQMGWDAAWGFNGNFPSPSAQRYVTWRIAHDPFHASNAFALARGWPEVWPEDEPFGPGAAEFVLVTLADAEPWYEVYRTTNGELFGVERCT